MKSNEFISLVLRHPGKTATELSHSTGESPVQISSALNRLVKQKRLTRYWKPGMRRCASAWRYWPVYDVEKQEEVVVHLHDLIRNHAKGNHDARSESGGHTFRQAHIGFALERIMNVFERGVASIQ